MTTPPSFVFTSLFDIDVTGNDTTASESRVVAMLLKYSCMAPIGCENNPATSGYSLENFAFDTMARAGDYKDRSILANPDSEQFWTSVSLESWLSACDETLCHGVWYTADHTSSLERVQVMHLALNILPCVGLSAVCVHQTQELTKLPRTWLCMLILLCGDSVTGEFALFSVEHA
jgi:hypothetical protein